MHSIILWGGRGEIIYLEIAHIRHQFYCEELHGGDFPQATTSPNWQHNTAWQGERTGSSSPKSEFLAFCGFKPYVDSPNF